MAPLGASIQRNSYLDVLFQHSKVFRPLPLSAYLISVLNQYPDCFQKSHSKRQIWFIPCQNIFGYVFFFFQGRSLNSFSVNYQGLSIVSSLCWVLLNLKSPPEITAPQFPAFCPSILEHSSNIGVLWQYPSFLIVCILQCFSELFSKCLLQGLVFRQSLTMSPWRS